MELKNKLGEFEMNCGNCGEHIVQGRNGRWYHSTRTDIDTGEFICHIEMNGCKNPSPFKL